MQLNRGHKMEETVDIEEWLSLEDIASVYNTSRRCEKKPCCIMMDRNHGGRMHMRSCYCNLHICSALQLVVVMP